VNVHKHNFLDCFRYWEIWSLGDLEKMENSSENSPKLQEAKAKKLRPSYRQVISSSLACNREEQVSVTARTHNSSRL
jgi:hypothetical protein